MSSTFGNTVRTTVFGQSHSEAIGCVIDNLPAGIAVDLDELQTFMARRAPGHSDTSTSRKEADQVQVLSGLVGGYTCGAPFAALIKNTNTRSQDYEQLRRIPRPGHADFPASVRYAGYQDVAGGGHFSGRLTAPLCISGGIAKQALKDAFDIEVVAHIAQLGPDPVLDDLLNPLSFDPTQQQAILAHELPVLDEDAASSMHEAIGAARKEKDSIGGIIECAIYNVPAGVGSPMADGLENQLARNLFGIPAVKGLEFGAGFDAALLYGSENNDPYCMDDDFIALTKNDAGGILGGISTGAPLVLDLAIKPTPSIAKAQQSVDLAEGKDATLEIVGRHDPCIVPRAVPVVEAVCALTMLDVLVSEGLFPTPEPKEFK